MRVGVGLGFELRVEVEVCVLVVEAEEGAEGEGVFDSCGCCLEEVRWDCLGGLGGEVG